MESLASSSNSFQNIIGTVIEEFNYKYPTIGSLQLILEQINALPAEELANHNKYITIIKGTIKGYGTKNKRLTNRQVSTLLSKLCDSINSQSSKVTNFDSDDVIFSVVFSLLINLDQNIMSSTLNTFIIDYFQIIGTLLNEAPDRYLDITYEIQKCLQNHGWDYIGNSSDGGTGFQGAPNRKMLVEDLKNIVDKYFY